MQQNHDQYDIVTLTSGKGDESEPTMPDLLNKGKSRSIAPQQLQQLVTGDESEPILPDMTAEESCGIKSVEGGELPRLDTQQSDDQKEPDQPYLDQ